MDQQPPTPSDVLAARHRLAGHVVRTPATAYPALDDVAHAAGAHDTRLVVKHENLQRTGSFKARGALNLLLHQGAPPAGIVGYSTGNHAQALAHAARQVGAPCTIVMPQAPNPVKERAVRALGADVVLHGADLTTAAAHAAHLAAARDARLVSAADEPDLVAGVATATLELLEDTGHLDVLVVPVGGGSGAAAACLVTSAFAPHVDVVGVQATGAPAAHDSWRTGHLVTRPIRTRAEGLATGRGFALTQGLMRTGLADFLLVDDDAISRAQHAYLTAARTVAEGAGAAALAAVLTHPDRFAGRRVGVVCSGGNASPDELLRALTSTGTAVPA
ncbi:threonine dehydratase [Isoptericola jiangsuensis]|uniref:threonine ammonia-lyase n=1 Tax=Isoptericola jiangsuensis TaxID=548579 RepID=A0A2A9EYE4_9MICO|nr:pyridoxal-phosphate dependent enzyme [Isoptericola jiangsuensis]PFG43179.1 threonine dehydratase [Isoptericola jiangsuensis]